MFNSANVLIERMRRELHYVFFFFFQFQNRLRGFLCSQEGGHPCPVFSLRERIFHHYIYSRISKLK